MRRGLILLLIIVCFSFTSCVSRPGFGQRKFERFFVWSMPLTESLALQAADIGATDVIVNHGNRVQLELAKKYQLRVYPCIVPTVGLWKKYRTEPAPQQVMLPEEEAIYQFRWIDKAEGLLNPSHYGGEPVYDPSTGKYLADPISTRLLCLSHPEVRKVVEQQIDTLCAKPEYDGIAFDFVGYMNGKGCYCDTCRQKYQQFLQQAGRKSFPAAEDAFYLQELVNFCNHMHRYIKEKCPNFKTMSHLYPVFLPQPLYGRLLEYDYCLETAAWYFPWSEEKILDYSRAISAYERGVHFIGYYKPRGTFPEKNAAKVDLELKTMLRGGARHLSVCGFQDVLENPVIYGVFKRYLQGAK